jgi:hypothetical protein
MALSNGRLAAATGDCAVYSEFTIYFTARPAMRAEDILPDAQDQTQFGGMTVRKGTIAAFLANARQWRDGDVAGRAQAEQDIIDALPSLRALGLFDVLEVRDPALRAWPT